MTDHNRRALTNILEGPVFLPTPEPDEPTDFYSPANVMRRAIQHALDWLSASSPLYPLGQVEQNGRFETVVWRLVESTFRDLPSQTEYSNSMSDVEYLGFDARGHLLRGRYYARRTDHRSAIMWHITDVNNLSDGEYLRVLRALNWLVTGVCPKPPSAVLAQEMHC